MWHSIYILVFVVVVSVTVSRFVAQYLSREQFRLHINEFTTPSLFQFSYEQLLQENDRAAAI